MIGAYATYATQSLFRAVMPDAFAWYPVAALPVAFVVAAAVGIVMVKSWPAIALALNLTDTRSPYPTRLAPGTAVASRSLPRDNRLVITSIGLNQRIVEGRTMAALKRGVWHQPPSATPRQDGNMIVAGHHVTSQFLLLDHVEKGDVVQVYWRQREYDYKVVSVKKKVHPKRYDLLRRGVDRKLTLYTCAPRRQGDLRTVVVAVPMR